MSLVVEDLFNPNFGLFETSYNGASLKPNPNSEIVPDHLTYFIFLGKLIGRAIIKKEPLNAFFVRSFLKQILGI
jgi:hypothetical protein